MRNECDKLSMFLESRLNESIYLATPALSSNTCPSPHQPADNHTATLSAGCRVNKAFAEQRLNQYAWLHRRNQLSFDSLQNSERPLGQLSTMRNPDVILDVLFLRITFTSCSSNETLQTITAGPNHLRFHERMRITLRTILVTTRC